MRRACTGIIFLSIILCSCTTLPIVPVEAPLVGNGEYTLLDATRHKGAKRGLVFALHGYGGDCLSYGRLWHEALRGEFLVVAPQAPEKKRKNGTVSTWSRSADRDYLNHIWREIHEKYNVDPARTVVIGYSAGATMAAEMARMHKGQTAGLVLHGAGLSGNISDMKELRVFLLAGSRDRGFNRTRAQGTRDRLIGQGIDAQTAVIEGADHASIYAKIAPAAAWITQEFTDK